jgi:hypothetical protein
MQLRSLLSVCIENEVVIHKHGDLISLLLPLRKENRMIKIEKIMLEINLTVGSSRWQENLQIKGLIIYF